MRWLSFQIILLFAGGLFILFGVSIILKVIWNIHLPVVRIGFALFLIYIGLALIFDSPRCKKDYEQVIQQGTEKTWLFTSSRTGLEDNVSSFHAIFSSLVADFSSISRDTKRVIYLKAIFGSIEVLLPVDVPVKIEGSAVFGEIQFPDNQNINFGSLSTGESASIVIVAEAVFGAIDFKVK